MKRFDFFQRIKRFGSVCAALAMIVGIFVGATGCALFAGKENTGAAIDYTEANYRMDAAPNAVKSNFTDQLTVLPTDEIPFEPGIEFNTEEYDVFKENRFLSTQKYPLSTFAADVDTASYANIRRQLGQGIMPQTDSVRIEEMLNYFTYDYERPADGDVLGVDLELTNTPWNTETQLLRIGVVTADPAGKELKDVANNLVFLIDVSGSMSDPDKLPLVKRSFLGLVETLGENDTVSIVTYASTDAVVLEGESGEEKTKIMTAIENLEAGGATYGSAGIRRAYEIAEENFIKGGNNRVILATDGDLNVGVSSTGDLIKLIEVKRDSDIFLSVLGFGYGNLKDDKMEALANHGNGQYNYIDTISEARKVLFEEAGQNLVTVAKDVKLQVDFNSANVKGYRLIGYENRAMADEDFADDTKDGGELGAGHRMTAIYELVLPGSKMEIPNTESKYNETNEKQESKDNTDELLTVNIRYKEPTGTQSKLISVPLKDDTFTDKPDDNTKLASAVAAFGMLLRESDFCGNADYDMVLNILNEIKRPDDYVVELKDLVEEAESLSSGAFPRRRTEKILPGINVDKTTPTYIE